MRLRNGVPLLPAVLILWVSPIMAAQNPMDAEGRFNLAVTHLRDGRIEMALEEFKRAIKQDPKNAFFYKGLGIAYSQWADRCEARDEGCRQGRLKDAVAAGRKALELNPYYVDVRNDLGAALVLMGKRDEGKKEFLSAFGDPTNPTPEITARNLGRAYYEEKNYAEALSWFRSSINKNKEYVDGYLGAAETLIAMEKIEEAALNLETALKAIPDNPGLLASLGEAYYRSGRFVEARAKLEQAVHKDPSGPAGRRANELLKHFPK